MGDCLFMREMGVEVGESLRSKDGGEDGTVEIIAWEFG